MKKFNKKLSLYEEFKLYETMWDEQALPLKEARRRSWYGADTEVEFDDSVYPEIAKYVSIIGSVRLLDKIKEKDIEEMIYRKMVQLLGGEWLTDETICKMGRW